MAGKDKDKKKGGKGAEEPAGPPSASIKAHPRAVVSIRRTRTRAAMIAFVLVLALNVVTHHDPFTSVLRALVAGIVVNLVVWRCAIVVWRHLIQNELRLAEQAYADRRREAIERMRQQAADSVGTRG